MCRGRAIETGLQRERPKERRTESKIRALRERERERQADDRRRNRKWKEKKTLNSESLRGSWGPEEQEGDTEPGAKRWEKRKEINNKGIRQRQKRYTRMNPCKMGTEGRNVSRVTPSSPSPVVPAHRPAWNVNYKLLLNNAERWLVP